jgi:3-oxoacyl-[acyl-carrier protein] reductase
MSIEPLPETLGGWALVTGGAGTIGAETVRLLAADGWPVAVNYRTDAHGAHALVAELRAQGLRALPVQGDIRDPAAVAAVFDEIERLGGPVLVLVNTVGMRADMLTPHLEEKEWADVLDANLSAAFRTIRRALTPMLRERWGRVISLASVAGIRASSGQANYVAAKAGLIGLTKTVAVEVAARGVTVNVVAPGYIPSRFNADVPATAIPPIPARRAGSGREVAACIRFLASADASYVTGTTLVVDGGMSA